MVEMTMMIYPARCSQFDRRHTRSSPCVTTFQILVNLAPILLWIDFKMSSDTVPFFDSLSSIYDTTILAEQTRRYQHLYDQFIDLYNAPPSHIVRAPGRVNLIVSSITSIY